MQDRSRLYPALAPVQGGLIVGSDGRLQYAPLAQSVPAPSAPSAPSVPQPVAAQLSYPLVSAPVSALGEGRAHCNCCGAGRQRHRPPRHGLQGPQPRSAAEPALGSFARARRILSARVCCLQTWLSRWQAQDFSQCAQVLESRSVHWARLCSCLRLPCNEEERMERSQRERGE
jgi:hypothetical protein